MEAFGVQYNGLASVPEHSPWFSDSTTGDLPVLYSHLNRSLISPHLLFPPFLLRPYYDTYFWKPTVQTGTNCPLANRSDQYCNDFCTLLFITYGLDA